jgi:hypothetical protein
LRCGSRFNALPTRNSDGNYPGGSGISDINTHGEWCCPRTETHLQVAHWYKRTVLQVSGKSTREMMASKIALILGYGSRVGASVAAKFFSAGYSVAVVSGSSQPGATKDYLSIAADLS